VNRVIQSLSTETKAALALLALCVGSRLLSAIYYIEDPDSLRFALSILDYDVTRLQPHFPAYPVFCWFVQLLTSLTGRYAVAFALVGGLSTWLVVMGLVRIAGEGLTGHRGLLIATLVFFNPLIWLMGNRFMPDLLGLAFLMAAFYCVTTGHKPLWGGFLTGMLAGIRLSYLPFMLVPALCHLAKGARRLPFLVAIAAGSGIWLIPLIGITGWSELVDAAKVQTGGHFSDFGGTVTTEPDLHSRMTGMVEGIWADGMGFYWADRHPSTIVATLALCIGIVPSLVRNLGGSTIGASFWIKAASWTVYLCWVFLAQNVVYKSRHVLPLIPFVLLAVVAAWSADAPLKTLRRTALGVFLVVYAYVTLNLAVQHTQPSAIAQIKDYLQAKSNADLHIVTVPLVEYYLSSQGLEAVYMTIEDETDRQSLDQIPREASIVAIGNPYAFPGRNLKYQRRFYHNPYVNRMWPEIGVYEY